MAARGAHGLRLLHRGMAGAVVLLSTRFQPHRYYTYLPAIPIAYVDRAKLWGHVFKD